MKTRDTQPRGADRPTIVRCHRCKDEIGVLEPGQDLPNLKRSPCSCSCALTKDTKEAPDGR